MCKSPGENCNANRRRNNQRQIVMEPAKTIIKILAVLRFPVRPTPVLQVREEEPKVPVEELESSFTEQIESLDAYKEGVCFDPKDAQYKNFTVEPSKTFRLFRRIAMRPPKTNRKRKP